MLRLCFIERNGLKTAQRINLADSQFVHHLQAMKDVVNKLYLAIATGKLLPVDPKDFVLLQKKMGLRQQPFGMAVAEV